MHRSHKCVMMIVARGNNEMRERTMEIKAILENGERFGFELKRGDLVDMVITDRFIVEEVTVDEYKREVTVYGLYVDENDVYTGKVFKSTDDLHVIYLLAE